MGDQIRTLIPGDSLPVEPKGTLATDGWYPGTWVKYTNDTLTFSGAMATVQISDGTGPLAGFLKTGPQHNEPMQQLSDMWRDDTSREGGDSYKDWTAFDAGAAFLFDENKQLKRMGSRIVTMVLCGSGAWKVYVFEVYDAAERANPGTGTTLTYLPNDMLYVSNRGYFTKEQESPTNMFTEYLVARTGTDTEGAFLIVMPTSG